MSEYKPLRRGDLVSLYKSVVGAPLAFSQPPMTLDDQYGKQVDVSDKMGSLWVVLEWVAPHQEEKQPAAPKRLSYYVKVTSGDRVCWVKEYYLDVVNRASYLMT
jgi:hypothetical protein